MKEKQTDWFLRNTARTWERQQYAWTRSTVNFDPALLSSTESDQDWHVRLLEAEHELLPLAREYLSTPPSRKKQRRRLCRRLLRVLDCYGLISRDVLRAILRRGPHGRTWGME